MSAMDKSKYVLEHEQVESIRRALLLGLECFGEIERLINAREFHEIGGDKVPEELCALHPTGAADTVCDFAKALTYLEYSKKAGTP